MPKLTSAEIVERMWLRFVKRYEQQYGVKLSMRGFSLDVLNHKTADQAQARPGQDAHALARWTNPGDRENYRIPLSRISELCLKLEATQEELDELMTARLGELSLSNPRHDSLVAGSWVAEVFTRTNALQPDEQVVLEVFREVTEHLGRRVLDTAHERERLKQVMTEFMAPQWDEFWREHGAVKEAESELTAEDTKHAQAQQRAILSKLKGLRRQQDAELSRSHKAERKQVSAQVIAKRLLKDIRGQLSKAR